MKLLGYGQVRPYTRPTWYPAVSEKESVIRLSLDNLLVNLLQVVKRTNTPLIPLQMASSAGPRFFWGREFKSHHPQKYFFQTFPTSNLKSALPGVPRKWNRLDIDRSARISGRPGIPPFQGERVIRFSLGELFVNFLQVVKRTNTPLII